MPPAIHIRLLTALDAAAAFALRQQALEEAPQSFGQSPHELVAMGVDGYAAELEPTSGRIVLGAFDGDALVAVAGLHRQTAMKLRHQAIVRGMYVTPSHRGCGLGRRLLDETLRRARTMEEVRIVLLWVVASLPAALRMYTDAGFEIWTTERMALRVGDEYFDEHVMGLVL